MTCRKGSWLDQQENIENICFTLVESSGSFMVYATSKALLGLWEYEEWSVLFFGVFFAIFIRWTLFTCCLYGWHKGFNNSRALLGLGLPLDQDQHLLPVCSDLVLLPWRICVFTQYILCKFLGLQSDFSCPAANMFTNTCPSHPITQ